MGRIDVVPRVLEVVCRITGLGFAAVARVTPERWVACAVRDDIGFGLLPAGELQVTTTICNDILQRPRTIAIDHVAEDAIFRDHPTPRLYGFQSYLSTPIYCRGQFFGTLCAIDPRPNKVRTPEILAMVELFAELIGNHLDGQARVAHSEAALVDERATSDLREQFIAVLGHDLRNPLAAIDAGAQMLAARRHADRSEAIVAGIRASAARMRGLIDSIMDFARGRLGGGFQLDRRVDPDLAATLEQVAAELRLAHGSRLIELDLAFQAPVACDSGRIAQLFSNLLANALTHGAAASPIRVRGRTAGGCLELSVANGGEPIPPDVLPSLFQPFTRASLRPGQAGLGLGLYIAAEIARAHGGSLTAASDAAETRFTLRIPAGKP